MGMDQYSQEDSIISAGSNALKIVLDEKKYTRNLCFVFYFRWKNLFSRTNGQLELQIWQDIVRDLFWDANYFQSEENYSLVREQGSLRNDLTFIFGFGYNEILPAMNHWERTGTDVPMKIPIIFLYTLWEEGV